MDEQTALTERTSIQTRSKSKDLGEEIRTIGGAISPERVAEHHALLEEQRNVAHFPKHLNVLI